MRSVAVGRVRRWPTLFGVGWFLVGVLGALAGPTAAAAFQEPAATYDYDGLSAPDWPDGAAALAETPPAESGVAAGVRAYDDDPPVAARPEGGHALCEGAFSQVLAGENTNIVPTVEGGRSTTSPPVLTYTPRTAGVADDALQYATRPEKLDHISVPKHNLDPLVRQFGSREAVVDQMLRGVSGRTPASGVFEIPVSIGGQTVVVRGAVVDGVVKLGTAFTP